MLREKLSSIPTGGSRPEASDRASGEAQVPPGSSQLLRGGAKPDDATTADPMRLYLSEITKIPLLSAEEELELARRIRAGDDEATGVGARRTVPLPTLALASSVGQDNAALELNLYPAAIMCICLFSE